MIDKILIEDSNSFKHIEITPHSGFNVISGVSGAGKSVFFSLILSAFGLKDAQARLVELNLDSINSDLLENYGILGKETTSISALKSKSTKYFINNQNISKKNLKELTSNFVKYINIKDASELESENLIQILDTLICLKDSKFIKILDEYKASFAKFKEVAKNLDSINEKQRNIENLRDFANFEIERIERVAPQVGEYERLLSEKKNLSRKEKVLSACDRAIESLENMDSVTNALELLDIDSIAFNSVMLDVKANIENAMNALESLDIEPEALLDRLSALADIIRRYGSEEAALKQLESQKEKLKEYENIDFDKNALQKEYKILESNLLNLASKITQNREKYKESMEKILNSFCEKLRLNMISLNIDSVNMEPSSDLPNSVARKLGEFGGDKISILLDKKNKNVLSSGEYNRLRLCVLCTMVSIEDCIESKSKKTKKIDSIESKKTLKTSTTAFSSKSAILILDEIDANLSGEESEGVAELLAFLAKKYQIFAISHQPFMPIFADNHYLISKDSKGGASVILLDNEGKIKEIARMISGSHLDSNTINYVTKWVQKHKKG